MKEYQDIDGEWQHIGATPIDGVRISADPKRWELRKAGFETLSLAGPPASLPPDQSLDEEGAVAAGMVRVPGFPGGFFGTTWITGLDPINGMPIDGFLMDAHEVTNAQFKRFVDAGRLRHTGVLDPRVQA